VTVDEVLSRGGEADDVLRSVVGALVESGDCMWAGILLSEEGELVLGPKAGEPRPDSRAHVPVVYRGARVAELVADGCDDRALLDRAAEGIAEYCLVGWDTGGVPW